MTSIARNIVVKVLPQISPYSDDVEMCEHKGVGHPDTLMDGLCEAASRALSLWYIRKYGQILHHNLDKGLLVAGKSKTRFGGGEIIEPINAFICGRASNIDRLNIQEIIVSGARDYLEANIRYPSQYFQIEPRVKEGSDNLKDIFQRASTNRLSNDTSFGVGYAPYSQLEKKVLTLAKRLHDPEFKARFTVAGDDFKIMGYRNNQTMSFTIALAFIDKYVDSPQHYFYIKEQIRDHLSDVIGLPNGVSLNVGDDPNASGESGLYLTVTGLSAEMGDDGQVGRGNRVNGLITPARPMSLEAAAGKNPVSHVGKIYSVLANLIARHIYDEFEEIEEVVIQLLSAIGKPIDQPQVALVKVRAKHGLDASLNLKIANVVDGSLKNISRVTELILNGSEHLY